MDLVWLGRGWLPGSPGFFLPVLPPKPLTTGMTTSHMVIIGQLDRIWSHGWQRWSRLGCLEGVWGHLHTCFSLQEGLSF